MPALRPIGHEDRLSLIDHLDELRTRLIWSIVVFALAFGFCYWQNGKVLSIVNKPVEQALKPARPPKHHLGQTTLFQEPFGEMAKPLVPLFCFLACSAASPADKKALS